MTTKKFSGALGNVDEKYITEATRLTDGTTSLDAAHFQMNLSGKSLLEMLNIMAKQYAAAGDHAKSEQCLRIANGVLDVFRNEGGKELEIPGYEWIDF